MAARKRFKTLDIYKRLVLDLDDPGRKYGRALGDDGHLGWRRIGTVYVVLVAPAYSRCASATGPC